MTTMTRTRDAGVEGYMRANRTNSDSAQQRPLFSLPNGESASFLLHNFENAGITRRIVGHGGRVTDDISTADVILTTRPDEYKCLKDQYAISRKTHVRMSGFVDRCINSRRFQLAPVVEKGVPGRRISTRRTEFTKEDDEHLCQYIAEVLPDKAQGGRTGHFIYADLIRRADEFGQYTWAHRHTKDGWRERYRKNQERLDNRIAEIVEGNPPAPNGKGQYKYRRYGRIDQDAELIADNTEFVELGAEEGGYSATDDEDGTVQTKRMNAQPQEEEEEEDEGQSYQPGATPNPRNHDHEPPEEAKKQIAEREPETGPFARVATQRGGASLSGAPVSKGRRIKRAQQLVEVPVPDDLDATLRGTEIDDKVAEGLGPPAGSLELPNSPEAVSGVMQPEIGRKRGRTNAQPIVRSISPRRTRAGSKLRPVNRHDATPPPVSQTTPRGKAKTKKSATVAATLPQPILGSQLPDEFVAYSDNEGDMHEVEANLQVSAVSPAAQGDMQGDVLADNQTHSASTDDLQDSRRLPTASPDDVAVADLDSSGDDTDAELFALVRKLDASARAQPPPEPKASLSKGDDDPDRSSSEDVFPSPGTRASAEKRRRTQAAKVTPYVPAWGTRAASMMEHGRTREAPVRRR